MHLYAKDLDDLLSLVSLRVQNVCGRSDGLGDNATKTTWREHWQLLQLFHTASKKLRMLECFVMDKSVLTATKHVPL